MKFLLVSALVILIGVWSPAPAAADDQSLLDTGAISITEVERWSIGEIRTVTINGVTYTGRYGGFKTIDGVGRYVLEHCQVQQSAPNGQGTSPSMDNNKGASKTSAGDAGQSTVDQGALNSAAIAAGTTVLYRVFIVPPSLVRDLDKAAKEYRDAKVKTTATVNGFRVIVEQANVSAGEWAKDLSQRLAKPVTVPAMNAAVTGTSTYTVSTSNVSDRTTLISLQARLDNATIIGPTAIDARDIGRAAVKVADTASVRDDRTGYETAVKIATVMADVLVGLDPFTGLARDAIEYYTGVNQITGEKLTEGERTLRLIGTAAGIVSFGVTSSFLHAAEKIAAVATRFERLAKPTTRLLENASRIVKTARGEYRLTDHVVERLEQRGLTKAQVRATLDRGERFFDRAHENISYVATKGFVRGKSLQVAVDAEEKVVVTAIKLDFNPATLMSDGRPRYIPFPEK
jgi:hypothetical protein